MELTHGERLLIVERDHRSLAGTLTAFEGELAAMNARLMDLENLKRGDAVREEERGKWRTERETRLEDRLIAIETGIKTIKGFGPKLAASAGEKIITAIISAAVGALIMWLVK